MIGGGVVGGLADDPIRQQRRRNRQRQNCLSWRKIVVVVYGWLTSSSSSPLLIFLCIETTTTNHPNNNNNNNKMWRPFSSNSVRALQVIPSLASTTRRRQSLLRYPTLPCTKRTKTIPKHYNTWDFSIYPTYLVVANAATEASKNNGDADSKGDFLMQRQSLLLQDLNTNQVSAVTQPLDQITRVVAGPGSGKTRVLTSRIAWLLLHEPHSRILAVTFTRKAADEMKQRVQKLVSDTTTTTTATATLDRVTLGTFHSIAAKILRWHGSSLASLPLIQQDMEKSDEPINLDGNFNIADQNEQLRVLKDVLKECNIDLQSLSPQGKEVKPLIILQAINRCKVLFSRGVNAFQNIDKDGTWITILASQLYYPYREKMLSANCIDFDDLILLTRQLLMVDENVKQRLQTYWPHVLVDEFQDTSESQVDLVKLLTRNSLFIVGDADQSIYSWRGAHASSLTDFENHFRDMHENGVSTVYLMENYRYDRNLDMRTVVFFLLVVAETAGKKNHEMGLHLTLFFL
jgi:DNA helicase-2/ATP-dependent DNA helicase PcrA